MNKNKALTAEETKAKRAEYSRACHVAQAAAVAAGFALSYGPGYWTALTTFCRENGIPHPSTRGLKTKTPKPAPKPTAEELAAAKRAAHAKAERERRARVKAAKPTAEELAAAKRAAHAKAERERRARVKAAKAAGAAK